MAKDANTRLKEYNAGKKRYIKVHLPWVIIYTENMLTGLRKNKRKIPQNYSR